MFLSQKLKKECDIRLSVILKAIITSFPDRIKRLVFISMLLSHLTNTDKPNRNIIARVNEAFKLAKDPKACDFPIAIKNVIWRDFNIGGVIIETFTRDGKTYVTPTSKVSLCYYIANNIPVWLKYSNNERVYTDTMMLIDSLERFDSFNYSS